MGILWAHAGAIECIACNCPLQYSCALLAGLNYLKLLATDESDFSLNDLYSCLHCRISLGTISLFNATRLKISVSMRCFITAMIPALSHESG